MSKTRMVLIDTRDVGAVRTANPDSLVAGIIESSHVVPLGKFTAGSIFQKIGHLVTQHLLSMAPPVEVLDPHRQVALELEIYQIRRVSSPISAGATGILMFKEKLTMAM